MMIKTITIGGFCLFTAILLLLSILLKIKGKGSLGRPSLPVYFFIIGKLSLFACMGGYIYSLLQSSYVNPFLVFFRIDYIAFAIYTVGMLITIAGLINLGLSLRMGLPNEETQLKTKGIYRLTRNPIYAGFNLICLASALNYPKLINVIFFVTVCVYHHFVIKAEEGFLGKKFGSLWEAYVRKTRRYL